MLRKSKALILCLMLCIGLLVPFDSKASGPEFYVSYAEPATNEYEGYVTLLLQNRTTGAYAVETLFWYCCATFNDYYNPCFMTMVVTPNLIQFAPGGNPGASPYYTLTDIDPTGRFSILFTSSSQRYELNFANYNWTIKAYKYAGNVGGMNVQGVDNSSNLFSVYFEQEGMYTSLMGILSCLLSTKNIDSSILTTVQSILNSVDGVENQLSQVVSYLEVINANLTIVDSKLAQLLEKANDILEEQKESNTWLEKIFNWLEDSPEQEKEAAQSQAGQSSSDAQASIEDKSAGFVDSVNGLASSMSYSGTQCAWTFPALYLPEIPGVMSRTQLTSEKPIDFAYWVNQIPSNLLLLVRSVLTIALIGYCFKEFYGVIEYVLTMRGGGNSE